MLARRATVKSSTCRDDRGRGQGAFRHRVDAAAAGVVDIVNNAMAEALRTVSVERGHDPREFSLVAFGGAGPLHAAALAEGRQPVVPDTGRSPEQRWVHKRVLQSGGARRQRE